MYDVLIPFVVGFAVGVALSIVITAINGRSRSRQCRLLVDGDAGGGVLLCEGELTVGQVGELQKKWGEVDEYAGLSPEERERAIEQDGRFCPGAD